MSLRVRILITICSVVVAITGSLAVVLGVVVQNQVETSALVASQRAGELLDDSINRFQEQLLGHTSLLADRPGTWTIYESDFRAISNHLSDNLKLIDADWLMLIDSRGEVIGCSYPKFPAGRNIADINPSLTVLLEGKPWRGIFPASDRASVAAAVPMTVDGELKAVLVSGKAIDKAFLTDISRASGNEVAVFLNGQRLASTTNLGDFSTEGSGLTRILIGSQAYVGSFKVTGKPSDQYKIQVFALVPETTITTPYEPLWRTLTGLLIAGLVAAVCFGALLAINLSRPLEALAKSAQNITQGIWPEAIDHVRKDEIGDLQRIFNEMALTLRDQQKRIAEMVDIDPLTELWNYASYREKLDSALHKWELEGGSLSVLILDIDQFDKFNQTSGRGQGDIALRRLASLLLEEVKHTGTCSRYGGNVFSVTLVDHINPMAFAESLRERIQDATLITVSIGVCSAGEVGKSSDVILLGAELAVSQAKAGGRNRVREFRGFELGEGNRDLKTFLQQGSYSAVRALAVAVDAKDEYTRGHSERVAEYGKELATAHGLEEGLVDLVYITGTLHDVGKIGVPDSVLKKPGRLTDEEFSLIKLHPEVGEKIVSQIPQLKDCLPGVRSHHERWDGRGYPDQLAGEEIPLIARLLAIVDTFDAMTSDRPYRKGLSAEEALEAIESGRGSQFDPDLATTFVNLKRSQDDGQKAA